MRLTDKLGAGGGSRVIGPAALVVLAALALAGCATTHEVVLSGDVLVDGPNAIANGPPRDRLLWEYRTAAAAMRVGKFDLAKQYLDDALTRLQGIYGPDPQARKARGYFHAEASKTFIGEPYERAMAYVYRGILYWMDGQPDNARACFRSAEIEDSDTEKHAYAGDWVLPDYFDGLATAKLSGDGSEAFKRAQADVKYLTLPPYDPKANVLFFFEFGPGPGKYATGRYAEQLRFSTPPSPVSSARLRIDTRDIAVAATDDVDFQATTRGGRVMDHILGNKAVFKTSTDVAGDVAIVGGAATLLADRGRNATADEVGAGLIVAGLISKLYGTVLGYDIGKLAMDMLGDRGMLAPGEDSAPAMGMFPAAYMWSLGVLIAGGTANIQRNIIAERGFGLPRDAAVSRR